VRGDQGCPSKSTLEGAHKGTAIIFPGRLSGVRVLHGAQAGLDKAGGMGGIWFFFPRTSYRAMQESCEKSSALGRVWSVVAYFCWLWLVVEAEFGGWLRNLLPRLDVLVDLCAQGTRSSRLLGRSICSDPTASRRHLGECAHQLLAIQTAHRRTMYLLTYTAIKVL
jgi:hypothetical protein